MTPAALHAFKARHKISTNELAVVFDVSRRTVHSWLIGERNISPPIAKLFRLVDKGQLTFEQIATA
jgi:DNA-binding transcriptional regulator YiaG